MDVFRKSIGFLSQVHYVSASLKFPFMGERVNVYVSPSLRRNLHAKLFATGKRGPVYINMRLCACLLKRAEFGGKLLSIRRARHESKARVLLLSEGDVDAMKIIRLITK